MIFYIDTTGHNKIHIEAKGGEKEVRVSREMKPGEKQSEEILNTAIDLFKENGLSFKDIDKIIVVDEGKGFTSLRSGVVFANALGYGLGIPVESVSGESSGIVRPIYEKPPITG